MREDYLQVTAPVFNIQPYSIHDGPGIRVTVFLKGCPLRCLWCANPESNLAAPQLMTYSSKCTGCGRCIPACPKGAIRLGEKDGKVVAVTDRSLCTDCGTCVAVCPNEAREIAGEEKTVQEVLDRVLQDKLFLDASSGGLTISGGEALMHPEFTACLFYAAKENGLHTAVESCCFASRETVEKAFRDVDLCLLDIKHMDSETHKKLTGVPNEQILDNIRYLYHTMQKQIVIRMPTIPGYNDSDENIAATAAFAARELGPDVAVHLLPYHRLGDAKSDSLGHPRDLGIEPPTDDYMQTRLEIVQSYGLQCQIGG